MFKSTTKTLKQAARLVFLIIGLFHMTSCTESVYQPQQNIVIIIDNEEQSHLLLDSIQKFASDNEYDYKTQAGNAEYLFQQGKFQVIFKNTTDHSFVSINNILKKQCVSISVYSGSGEQEAEKVMDKIKQSITSIVDVNRRGKC